MPFYWVFLLLHLQGMDPTLGDWSAGFELTHACYAKRIRHLRPTSRWDLIDPQKARYCMNFQVHLVSQFSSPCVTLGIVRIRALYMAKLFYRGRV